MGLAKCATCGTTTTGPHTCRSTQVRHEAPDSQTSPGDTKLTITREDATIGNERLLRGIPVAGVGGGAINGTRPGDPARHLNDAGRRIVRNRTHYKPEENA